MKYKTYASIYIGTYEVTMQVMEIHPTAKYPIRFIDEIKIPIALYHDQLTYGKLSADTLKQLLDALTDMKDTIDSYRVDKYEIFAGYMVRELSDFYLIRDKISRIIPVPLQVLSNSEFRFINYGAIVSQKDFDDLLTDSALIVDVGGSSLQLSLFEDGKLLTSQHILLGASQVREHLKRLSEKTDAQSQIIEMIYKELDTFAHMFYPDMAPKYMILCNDTFRNILSLFKNSEKGLTISRKDSIDIVEKMMDPDYYYKVSQDFSLSDPDDMHMPFILLYYAILQKVKCDNVILPGASLHEGLALSYGIKNGIIKSVHDFDKDVLSSAWQIALRYDSYKPHLKMLEQLSTMLFDAIKKQQGLTKRHRLFIRICAIMHDCGKYISLSSAGESTYTIIMSSEVIGITHDERKLIACVCANIHSADITYPALSDKLSEEEYVIFLKLLAILRVANALDRSHKQKLKDVKIAKKGNQLVIKSMAKSSFNLEKLMFDEKAELFSRVFGLWPVIEDHN